MPFFKKKTPKAEEAGAAGYPTQGSGYPTAGSAPPIGAAAPPLSGPQPGAPPPYTPYGQPPPPAPQAAYGGAYGATYGGYAPYPGESPLRPNYGKTQSFAAPYPQHVPPGQGMPQMTYTVPQPQQPVVAQFDAGARLGSGPVRIPPPPPGCMPNAAQMAATQPGNTIQVTQKKSNVWTDGGGGGYTLF